MLNIVISNWKSKFSSTYNKLRSQNTRIMDLRKKRDMTTDPKLKMALTNHIPKEKELLLQLSKHEREWI
jgi:hypothetical protein